MPKEETIISDTKVKYKGNFDFLLLYKKLKEWFLREGYGDAWKNEKKYAEKIKPNGKNVEIIWEMSRKEEQDYFQVNINVSFFAVGLTDVEVEKDGKRIKLNNAEIELKFDSKLIRNANKKWDENSLMFKFYEKYLVQDRTEFYRIECYQDTQNLIDETKNFFNLYRF